MRDVSSAALPMVHSTTTTRPVRAANVESDVIVPILQALITALVAGLITAIVALFVNWSWLSPLIAFGAVLSLIWLLFLIQHRLSLSTRETVSMQEEPKPQSRTWDIQGEFYNPETGQMYRPTFPGRPRYLRGFAQNVLISDVSFSVRGARKSGLSDTEFEELRMLFFSNEWAEWRSPGQPRLGVELTPEGRQILDGIARSPLPRPEG